MIHSQKEIGATMPEPASYTTSTDHILQKDFDLQLKLEFFFLDVIVFLFAPVFFGFVAVLILYFSL